MSPSPTPDETRDVLRRLEELHKRLAIEGSYYRAHVVWLAIDLIKRLSRKKGDGDR